MSEPFMPTVHVEPDAKVVTTWGILDGLRKQIEDRDRRIAELEMSVSALTAQLKMRY